MKFDKKLAWQMSKLPKEVKESLGGDELVQRYETAALLSNGPDPDRCAYWERKASQLKKKIEEILKMHPVALPQIKKDK